MCLNISFVLTILDRHQFNLTQQDDGGQYTQNTTEFISRRLNYSYSIFLDLYFFVITRKFFIIMKFSFTWWSSSKLNS